MFRNDCGAGAAFVTQGCTAPLALLDVDDLPGVDECARLLKKVREWIAKDSALLERSTWREWHAVQGAHQFVRIAASTKEPWRLGTAPIKKCLSRSCGWRPCVGR